MQYWHMSFPRAKVAGNRACSDEWQQHWGEQRKCSDKYDSMHSKAMSNTTSNDGREFGRAQQISLAVATVANRVTKRAVRATAEQAASTHDGTFGIAANAKRFLTPQMNNNGQHYLLFSGMLPHRDQKIDRAR